MDNVQIDDCTGSNVSRSVSSILGRREESNVMSLSADDVGDRRVVARFEKGACA